MSVPMGVQAQSMVVNSLFTLGLLDITSLEVANYAVMVIVFTASYLINENCANTFRQSLSTFFKRHLPEGNDDMTKYLLDHFLCRANRLCLLIAAHVSFFFLVNIFTIAAWVIFFCTSIPGVLVLFFLCLKITAQQQRMATPNDMRPKGLHPIIFQVLSWVIASVVLSLTYLQNDTLNLAFNPLQLLCVVLYSPLIWIPLALPILIGSEVVHRHFMAPLYSDDRQQSVLFTYGFGTFVAGAIYAQLIANAMTPALVFIEPCRWVWLLMPMSFFALFYSGSYNQLVRLRRTTLIRNVAPALQQVSFRHDERVNARVREAMGLVDIASKTVTQEAVSKVVAGDVQDVKEWAQNGKNMVKAARKGKMVVALTRWIKQVLKDGYECSADLKFTMDNPTGSEISFSQNSIIEVSAGQQRLAEIQINEFGVDPSRANHAPIFPRATIRIFPGNILKIDDWNMTSKVTMHVDVDNAPAVPVSIEGLITRIVHGWVGEHPGELDAQYDTETSEGFMKMCEAMLQRLLATGKYGLDQVESKTRDEEVKQVFRAIALCKHKFEKVRKDYQEGDMQLSLITLLDELTDDPEFEYIWTLASPASLRLGVHSVKEIVGGSLYRMLVEHARNTQVSDSKGLSADFYALLALYSVLDLTPEEQWRQVLQTPLIRRVSGSNLPNDTDGSGSGGNGGGSCSSNSSSSGSCSSGSGGGSCSSGSGGDYYGFGNSVSSCSSNSSSNNGVSHSGLYPSLAEEKYPGRSGVGDGPIPPVASQRGFGMGDGPSAPPAASQRGFGVGDGPSAPPAASQRGFGMGDGPVPPAASQRGFGMGDGPLPPVASQRGFGVGDGPVPPAANQRGSGVGDGPIPMAQPVQGPIPLVSQSGAAVPVANQPGAGMGDGPFTMAGPRGSGPMSHPPGGAGFAAANDDDYVREMKHDEGYRQPLPSPPTDFAVDDIQPPGGAPLAVWRGSSSSSSSSGAPP